MLTDSLASHRAINEALGESPARHAQIVPLPATRLLNTARFILVAGVMACSGLLVAALIVVPGLFGGAPYVILTKSMAPTFPPGTIVVAMQTQPADIRIGDVLTFQAAPGQPEVISHRVVEQTQNASGERSFITRGDNNSINDSRPVRYVQIRGVVRYAIPYVGFLSASMPQSAKMWLGYSLGGIFLVGGGIMIVLHFRSRFRQPGTSPDGSVAS